MINLLKRMFYSEKRARKNIQEIPFKGYESSSMGIRFVDYLTDDELRELNALVKWKAFTVDKAGRRFGDRAWSSKRETPQNIPDARHLFLNERVPLATKKVLEIGCFEGIHTISLCNLANEVIAIDSRLENIIKTLVRCNLYNRKPTVFKCDVEVWDTPKEWLSADVCHHIGVLYHLKDPVGHLRVLSTLIKDAIFLDTHIALPTDQMEEYTVEGRSFKYKKYLERGKKDVFSGMYDHAKWLLLQDIESILTEYGFTKIELIEERAERNGPRVLLLARR